MVAAVECKSNLCIQFEAENKNAVNAIKMLDRLSMLDGLALNLPVVCITCFGANFTESIANLRMMKGRIQYRIQKLWSANMCVLSSSLQFQIVLWKLARWVREHSLPVKQEALEIYLSSDPP